MTISTGTPDPKLATAMPPVLIVDDSKAQRRLLVRSLAKWGYDAIEAASGEEALALCKATSFDIIVSDWMMPGMSGVEFCKSFRALGDRPTFFILLTAQTEREVLAEGLESGADDFLSKPFNAVEMRARLRAGERILHAQRALAEKNQALSSALDKLSDAYAAIDRDLRGARSFQEGLIPERFAKFEGADIALLFRSSGHVGGDLVGHFKVNDQEIGVFSVDVSGHGVASALMTARIAGFFSEAAPDRNLALTKGAGGYEMLALDETCHRLNRILTADAESDQYLTMTLAKVNLSTGRIELCQAGHPSPAIQRQDGRVEFIELWSTPIGLIDDGDFATGEVELQPGERMILYSDGLTECPNPDGDLLDEDGFAEILKESRMKKGEELIAEISKALVAYHGNDEFPDDLSALVLERH